MTLDEFLEPGKLSAHLHALSSRTLVVRGAAIASVSGRIFQGLSILTLSPGPEPGEVTVTVTIPPVLAEPVPYGFDREGRRELLVEKVDDYVGRMFGRSSQTFALDEGDGVKVLKGTLRAGADF